MDILGTKDDKNKKEPLPFVNLEDIAAPGSVQEPNKPPVVRLEDIAAPDSIRQPAEENKTIPRLEDIAEPGSIRQPAGEPKAAKTEEASWYDSPWNQAAIDYVNKYIVSKPKPADEVYKLGSSLQIAQVFGMNPRLAYENIDYIGQTLFGEFLTPKVIAQEVGTYFNRGKMTTKIGEIGWEAWNSPNPEDYVDKIVELQNQLPPISEHEENLFVKV